MCYAQNSPFRIGHLSLEMKKKVPHWGIGRRLMTAGGLGMVGSFIGWLGVSVALST
jgi:hypothetical protein